jgi:hypothetical protein
MGRMGDQRAATKAGMKAMAAGIHEAEKEIYEMLLADPDESSKPEAELRQQAHDVARACANIRANEIATGKEVDIICVCGEPQSVHVGGVGRCKHPNCGCDMFSPDRIKMADIQ